MQHISAPQLAQVIRSDAVRAPVNDASLGDAQHLFSPLARAKVQLLDVRESWELEIASLSEITHIPMGEITARYRELQQDQPVVCICHHGVRSLQVGLFLEHQGFENVFNLTGGMDAWSKLVDSSCRSY
jgi:rhodanese-related sulfurtransferase